MLLTQSGAGRSGIDAGRWRDAFFAAHYLPDAVAELLGPQAHAALARDESVPAERATRGGSPLETLVRLFSLRRPVRRDQAAAALPLGEALAAGILVEDGAQIRAALDVTPYHRAGWWVVSDHGTGLDGITRPLPSDYVLGVGGASVSLTNLTVPAEVDSALDIGTGCGVQGLHLSEHAGRVTATDVLPRALHLARLTAALSQVPMDLRPGSLYEPVAGERFDLVVSNPPFVISWRPSGPGPSGSSGPLHTHTYRDSGLPGDDVCAWLVSGAAGVLAPGGWCQLLANWVHHPGQDWAERVAGWVPPGCDGWIVQRDVQDPAEYVGTWLRDAGETGSPNYRAAYEEWLRAFQDHGVDGVGFGWVSLRRTDSVDPVLRVEEWVHPVEQPIGPHVQAWFTRSRALADMDDASLWASRLIVASDVGQEQLGRPGAEDPEHLVLRQHRGMRRAARVSSAEAGFVGACDGTLRADQLAAAVADLLGIDEQETRAQLLPRIRSFIAEGLLELAPPRSTGHP